jgi:hypothetical protein
MVKTDLIVNVIIAMFIYNIIIKAISATIMKYLFQTKIVQEASRDVRKTFAEKLAEKQKSE